MARRGGGGSVQPSTPGVSSPTPSPTPTGGGSGGAGLSADAAAKIDAILSGQGVVATNDDPDVSLGNLVIETGRKGQEGSRAHIVKQSEANLYIRSQLELKRWEKALLEAGKIEEGKYDYSTLVQLWEAYIQESASWVAKGKPMGPYELLEMDADLSGSRKKKDEKSKSTNNQTSTSVDLTDPTTARGIIDNAYQAATGQMPTNEQREDFLAMLNDAERRHPNVSTSTQTSTSTGAEGDTTTNTDSSSMSSGGVSPQVLAQDQAMQDPGYGAYQASTVYANALFEALRSPV